MTLNASTVTVSVNAVNKVLNRIRDDGYSAEYLLREATQEFRLKVRHSTIVDKSRGGITIERHNLELTNTVYPVSPATVPTIRKCYSVFEQDFGDSNTNAGYVFSGLVAFETATVISDLQAWMA